MIELASRRGRPSATMLAERLERSRGDNADLVDELRAERFENREFAERVRDRATRLSHAARAGDRLIVEQVASELGYHAARRLRQLEAVR